MTKKRLLTPAEFCAVLGHMPEGMHRATLHATCHGGPLTVGYDRRTSILSMSCAKCGLTMIGIKLNALGADPGVLGKVAAKQEQDEEGEDEKAD